MAYDGPVPPPFLVELIAFFHDGDLGLAIGCDSNAHHTSWGNRNRNMRGHDLSEFLELGVIPSSWRETKLVFIPKTGRVDLDNPKA